MFTVYAMNHALAAMPDVRLTLLTTDSAGPSRDQRLSIDQIRGLYSEYPVVMTRRVAGASVSWALLRRLPSLVKRADVVHLTAIYSFPTLPTLLLCRLMGKPLVWSPHGAIQDAEEWDGSRRRGPKRAWERVCNALALPDRTVMHVTSERERGPTEARLPRLRSAVVPNGVVCPPALPEKRWRPGGVLRLVYLGRLSPKKGVENLLRAMSILSDAEVGLSIYGTGEADYVAGLRDLATDLGLFGGKVHFAGHVDGEAKTRAFLEADICVVPSHTECFCMVVAESLAHGVPVIASHGTPWQGLEEKQCGRWVDNEPSSLANAILELARCDLPRMGDIGREWMRTEFGWGNVARKMYDLYVSLVRGAGATGEARARS